MLKRLRSRVAVIVGFMLVTLSLLISVPLSNMANLNDHLDMFSSCIKNGDKDGAEKALKQLKADYNYLADMKLRYFADNFWFADVFLYEADIAYLAEDYDRVEKLLSGHENDYRAAYLAGLYKYRLFQSASQKAKTEKVKKEILSRAMERTMPDFEKCVKDGLGIVSNFNCSFDYDLVSNPESIKNALQNPKSGPKFILGIPAIPSGSGQKPGQKSPLDQKPGFGAGSNDPKKGG